MVQITEKLLTNKVAIISGSSRGIGAATAVALARNGCHVVITGRTEIPTDNQNSTIHTVASQCREYDVEAIAIKCDITKEKDIVNVVTETIKKFGKLDILINAASEMYFTGTSYINENTFNLLHNTNVKGTYFMSQACLSFLKASGNGHILNFSPPLTLDATYFSTHCAYTISKYAMSMCTLSMAHEYYHDDIAVNSLWSRTFIASDTLLARTNGRLKQVAMRKPEIMADAAVHIVSKPTKVHSGCFLIDDLVLMSAGVTDFSVYAVEKGHELMRNIFLPHDLPSV
jgi:citronellol/citronellal dehydrogenase